MHNQNYNHKNLLKKRCFLFSLAIVKFIDILPQRLIEGVLSKQLLRAATSIGANIIEAFGSDSKKDFQRFFSIALKSANETMYWLYLLRESKKGDPDKIDVLIKECSEITKMIAASILTMKGKREPKN